jgi:hypothetical protein
MGDTYTCTLTQAGNLCPALKKNPHKPSYFARLLADKGFFPFIAAPPSEFCKKHGS